MIAEQLNPQQLMQSAQINRVRQVIANPADTRVLVSDYLNRPIIRTARCLLGRIVA